MDLVTSMQSEGLPKDLQGNLRISPQTWGFHDEMNRIEIKGNDPTQTAVIWVRSRSVFWKIQLSETHYIWIESGTDRGDCVKGNHCLSHTDN